MLGAPLFQKHCDLGSSRELGAVFLRVRYFPRDVCLGPVFESSNGLTCLCPCTLFLKQAMSRELQALGKAFAASVDGSRRVRELLRRWSRVRSFADERHTNGDVYRDGFEATKEMLTITPGPVVKEFCSLHKRY